MVLVRPCKTTAAYEALPERELHLDLSRVGKKVAEAGWSTVADAGVLLLVRKEVDATIFRSGKLLIKTLDPRVAQRVWDELGPLYGGA